MGIDIEKHILKLCSKF